MINVTFLTQNKNFVGVLSEGHAEYDSYGKDIVCSAVSSLTQSLALGILKVLNIKAVYNVNEKQGKLELRLPKKIDEESLTKSQILLKTTYLSIMDLSKGYPSNIKVEVKDLCL